MSPTDISPDQNNDTKEAYDDNVERVEHDSTNVTINQRLTEEEEEDLKDVIIANNNINGSFTTNNEKYSLGVSSFHCKDIFCNFWSFIEQCHVFGDIRNYTTI